MCWRACCLAALDSKDRIILANEGLEGLVLYEKRGKIINKVVILFDLSVACIFYELVIFFSGTHILPIM